MITMSLNKTGLVVVLVVIVVIASAGVYYFTSQEEDGKTVLKPGSYAKYNLEGTAVSDNPSMTFDIEGDANLVVVAVSDTESFIENTMTMKLWYGETIVNETTESNISPIIHSTGMYEGAIKTGSVSLSTINGIKEVEVWEGNEAGGLSKYYVDGDVIYRTTLELEDQGIKMSLKLDLTSINYEYIENFNEPSNVGSYYEYDLSAYNSSIGENITGTAKIECVGTTENNLYYLISMEAGELSNSEYDELDDSMYPVGIVNIGTTSISTIDGVLELSVWQDKTNEYTATYYIGNDVLYKYEYIEGSVTIELNLTSMNS